jgi:hypothetical protein
MGLHDDDPPMKAAGRTPISSEETFHAGKGMDAGQEPMLYCPRCSARLVPLKCKLICEQCGYYMSCADYY